MSNQHNPQGGSWQSGPATGAGSSQTPQLNMEPPLPTFVVTDDSGGSPFHGLSSSLPQGNGSGFGPGLTSNNRFDQSYNASHTLDYPGKPQTHPLAVRTRRADGKERTDCLEAVFDGSSQSSVMSRRAAGYLKVRAYTMPPSNSVAPLTIFGQMRCRFFIRGTLWCLKLGIPDSVAFQIGVSDQNLPYGIDILIGQRMIHKLQQQFPAFLARAAGVVLYPQPSMPQSYTMQATSMNPAATDYSNVQDFGGQSLVSWNMPSPARSAVQSSGLSVVSPGFTSNHSTFNSNLPSTSATSMSAIPAACTLHQDQPSSLRSRKRSRNAKDVQRRMSLAPQNVLYGSSSSNRDQQAAFGDLAYGQPAGMTFGASPYANLAPPGTTEDPGDEAATFAAISYANLFPPDGTEDRGDGAQSNSQA